MVIYVFYARGDYTEESGTGQSERLAENKSKFHPQITIGIKDQIMVPDAFFKLSKSNPEYKKYSRNAGKKRYAFLVASVIMKLAGDRRNNRVMDTLKCVRYSG